MNATNWWPTRKEQDTAPVDGVVRPLSVDAFVVPLRLAELCLFWARAPRDPQQIVGVYGVEGRPIHVDLIVAAILSLETLPDAGALRLAGKLRSVMAQQDPVELPYIPDEMVYRTKDKAKLRCGYMTDPAGKIRCSRVGSYNVRGARGSFCELHARRTVIAKEAQYERAKKAKALGARRRAANKQPVATLD